MNEPIRTVSESSSNRPQLVADRSRELTDVNRGTEKDTKRRGKKKKGANT